MARQELSSAFIQSAPKRVSRAKENLGKSVKRTKKERRRMLLCVIAPNQDEGSPGWLKISSST
jgi:hypothetical protein